MTARQRGANRGTLVTFLHGGGKPKTELEELTHPGVTGVSQGQIEEAPHGLSLAECFSPSPGAQ